MNAWLGRTTGRLVVGAASITAVVVLLPGAAQAHPLGNFTVNRYSGVLVSPDAVTIDHVRDLAEIPTAQRTPGIDTTGDGDLSPDELRAWSRRECRSAVDDLRLRVDGADEPLSVQDARARQAPGQAGLPVLRLECSLSAHVTITGAVTVQLRDVGAGREVGWREMTAVGDGVMLTATEVPTRSPSSRLTSYPTDLLSSPLDVTTAQLEVRPGGERTNPVTGSDDVVSVVPRSVDRLTSAFEGLAVRAGDSPLLALLALVAAVLLGAAHALAPGHGKTVMAFYLSGRRDGAVRAATTVGLTVTATHTAGVLLIGLAVSAGTAFAPARLYPWLSVLSGLLVVAVGTSLVRAARHPHRHAHSPEDDHDHAHGHGAPHGHGHAHVHGGVSGHTVATLEPPRPAAGGHHAHHSHHHENDLPDPPSRRGLVAMGLAGGLVPSPSALVVFLGASGLGHPWLGVALVVAFGTGMATTLAAVGVVVMRLRDRAETRLRARPSSRFAPLLRAAPVITAAAVVLLGSTVAMRGLMGTGLL